MICLFFLVVILSFGNAEKECMTLEECTKDMLEARELHEDRYVKTIAELGIISSSLHYNLTVFIDNFNEKIRKGPKTCRQFQMALGIEYYYFTTSEKCEIPVEVEKHFSEQKFKTSKDIAMIASGNDEEKKEYCKILVDLSHQICKPVKHLLQVALNCDVIGNLRRLFKLDDYEKCVEETSKNANEVAPKI